MPFFDLFNRFSRFVKEPPPQEFVALFGPRPDRANPLYSGLSNLEMRFRQQEWDSLLDQFKEAAPRPPLAGVPTGLGPKAIDFAINKALRYGLGEPMFFRFDDRWFVGFPDGPIVGFHASSKSFLLGPDAVVAKYQTMMVRRGIQPDGESRHPWVK